MFYGDTIFSIELPQFLEIMVVKTEGTERWRNDEKRSSRNRGESRGAAVY